MLRYPFLLIVTFFTPWFFGCASEDGTELSRVGLQKLTVRDGAIGDQVGGGSGGSGGDGTDSVAVFGRTVHPLLQSWCQSCHATAQSPLIANPDGEVAHEALLTAQKVDFQDPSRSRIVLRLSQDNHNCPVEGCESGAAALEAAIVEWAAELTVDGPSGNPGATNALRFANATPKRVNGDTPANVIRLEAEAGTFKAPFAMLDVGTASGGKVAQTPAGAGSQNNQQTAAQQNTLGTIIYDFAVTQAGTYRLHGLVNAPTAANNAFWVRMDNGALQGWQFPANGAMYTWDLADNVVDVGTPLAFNLTAGNHRFEIRQREEQTKVDVLVLTSDATFNPANAKPPFRDVSLLTFDLAEKLGVGAALTVEVSDYSANAYMFKNPTLVLPSGSAKVKGLKLLINGVFLPQHATYTAVDQTVAAPGGVLSEAALVALKDKGLDADEFQFMFESIEKTP